MVRTTEQEIIDTYARLDSIKATARELCTSEYTVRRVLICNGLHENEVSVEIQRLLEQGLTVPEIAERIGLKPKTVGMYLPYKKGGYTTTPQSVNAKRIEKCRGKKNERRPQNGR